MCQWGNRGTKRLSSLPKGSHSCVLEGGCKHRSVGPDVLAVAHCPPTLSLPSSQEVGTALQNQCIVNAGELRVSAGRGLYGAP